MAEPAKIAEKTVSDVGLDIGKAKLTDDRIEKDDVLVVVGADDNIEKMSIPQKGKKQ